MNWPPSSSSSSLARCCCFFLEEEQEEEGEERSRSRSRSLSPGWVPLLQAGLSSASFVMEKAPPGLAWPWLSPSSALCSGGLQAGEGISPLRATGERRT